MNRDDDAPGTNPGPDSTISKYANEADGPGQPDEQVSPHGKRAVLVAAALGGLVLGGLLVDSLISASAPAPAPAKETANAPVPQDPFVDFEERQRLEAARLEAERQRRLAEQKNRGEPEMRASFDAPPAPRERTPEEEARDEARLEDLKRALAAVSSKDMVIDGREPKDATGVAKSMAVSPARAAGGKPAAAQTATDGAPNAESTLARLRQALDRAKGGGGGGAGGYVSTVADAANDLGRGAGGNAVQFARDLRGSSAASAVVGQSASMRREQGEGPRPGEYLVPVGSVMSAVLDMEVNSDWEGRWRAMITRDVYDIDQDVILIPKGTRVLGTSVRPKPVNEAINERMALTAQWLVLPNGARIDLARSSMLDAGGVAAIEGDVNRHFLAMLGGVVAYGVIGGLGAAEAARRADRDPTVAAAGIISGGRSAGAEIASGLSDIGKRIASRYLNLVPTITLNPGTPMNVFLDDEMYLKPWAPIDEFSTAMSPR